jgi:DNA gyrase subunit A
MGPAAKGKAIVNLLQLSNTERVAATVAIRDFTDDKYLLFATERGTVKKTELSAYANPRAGGIIGINIDETDRLLDIRITDGEKNILLATAKGFAIRFSEKDARPMGRATRGVRGISLRKGDRVVGMEVLEEEGEILSMAEGAVGKRTPVSQYRLQSRGGKGIINLKVSAKTGEVIGAKQVRPDDGMILITQEGKIIRINVEGVRVSSRSTQGVKLMNLDASDRLVAVAKLAERAEDDGIEAAETVESAAAEEPAEPVN